MSYVTTCPSCITSFRVTDEQLRVRDGRVRCGRCSTVFDARESLANEAEFVTPAVAAESPETDSALQGPAPDIGREIELVEAELAATEVPVAEPPPAEPVAPTAPEIEEISLSEPVRESAAADEFEEFGFGPEHQRRSRLAAIAWGISGLFAALALAGQVAYAYRSELVLLWPASRPWIDAACARMGCNIPLPRHAELIAIETSELYAEKAVPGVVTLAAVLRNRAAFPQAYPAVELTLTGTNDEAVARRVLWPGDYLGERTAESEFAPGAERALKLHLDVSGLAAAGYRLYVFHP